MELHGTMSVDILVYSAMIATVAGLISYVLMLLLRLHRKWFWKLLYAMIIAVSIFSVVNVSSSRSTLITSQQQLDYLRESLRKGEVIRVYNEFQKSIFEDIELYEILDPDPKLISEIMSLIDSSLLQAIPASGIAATYSRFDFEIRNSTQITSFAIIDYNVVEIQSKEKLYRYRSKNLKLYEGIGAILRRSQLASENNNGIN